MSGPRYTGWHHTRIVGDRDAGSVYLPEARTLLGYVMDEAERNQLGVHSARRELKDGTVLIAEKHGGVPRVTIIPPAPVPARAPATTPNDFVVCPVGGGYPSGLDPQYPNLLLRAFATKSKTLAEGGDGIVALETGSPASVTWKTYFYDDETAGYDAFAGAKGTYAGTFPDGVVHSGNVDWVGSRDERISWYGPSSRYWYDGFRQPRAQFGKFVFHLGQVLLDVDAYCTDNDVDLPERYVLGAALDRASTVLRVVMADVPPAVTWPSPPAAPSTVPDGWASPSYPTGSANVVLREFVLAEAPAGQPVRRVVVGHSDLWSGVLDRPWVTWCFDETASRVVAHLLPASSQMVQRGTSYEMPSASHQRVEVSFADLSGWTAETASVSLPGAVAEDGASAMTVEWSDGALYYALPGARYIALSRSGFEYTRRQVMWADLRERVLAVWEFSQHHVGPGAYDFEYRDRVLVCRDGVETAVFESAETATLPANTASIVGAALDRLATSTVSPLAAMHLHAFGMTATNYLSADHGVGLLYAPLQVPFRELDTFGLVKMSTAGSWAVTAYKADSASTTQANSQTDSHGHTTMPGVASRDGITAISYNSNVYYGPDETIVNSITSGDLAELTPVGGTNARYHPIWLLGQPLPEAA